MDKSVMSVLALIGSQRKLGNCELFAKEVARNIPVAHSLSLIRVPSLRIEPCAGCYRCIGHDRCPTEDHIHFIAREISLCDALIVASPVYFLGAHGSMKSLLDRTFAFYGILQNTRGKPCILVNTYGMKESFGTASHTLLTFASFLGLDIKATVNILAALPGEFLTDEDHMNTAARLGRMLFSSEGQDRPPRSCPFCGCDTVTIRQTDFLCCLCHGSFTLDNGGKPTKGTPGWDMESTAFVDAHREWLKGMKARFSSMRKEMLARTLPYKEEGLWVQPD